MAAGFPSTAISSSPASRPLPAYSNMKPPGAAISGMEAIRQGLGGSVLNASRIKLDPDYLAGIQDGQPALKDPFEKRVTGWPPADRALGKVKQAGAYGWQGFSVVAADTWRGGVLGALGGGALGLVGGGLTKLARQSWPLAATLPAGLMIGGSLGTFGGGMAVFVRSAWNLGKHVKNSLKSEYQGLKAKIKAKAGSM